MSPGANKRQTGTVPKAKASRKNSVPQEIVAPTRRDLQQHLNVSVRLSFQSVFEPVQNATADFIFLLTTKSSEAGDDA